MSTDMLTVQVNYSRMTGFWDAVVRHHPQTGKDPRALWAAAGDLPGVVQNVPGTVDTAGADYLMIEDVAQAFTTWWSGSRPSSSPGGTHALN